MAEGLRRVPRSGSGSHYLGVDVGTSGCKSALISARGRLVATASATYPTRRTGDGEVTQAPRDWLRAAAATMRECTARTDGQVAGICVTAPSHVGVLLDRDAEPIGRALLYSDARPEAVAAELRRTYGDGFFETTFVELTSAWTLPQLVWLRRELGRRAWSRVRRLLMQKDYVRFAMTGSVATDPSDAVGTAMVDQRTGAWSAELCAEAGLSPRQLPAITPVDAIGGALNRSWSQRTGIPAGTPVAVGGTDTVAELVSLNAVEPGDSIVKIASTGTIVTVSDTPRPNPQLLTYPHGLPGRWYSAAATNSAATAYNWLRGVIGAGRTLGPAAYSAMDRAAGRVPPGAEGALFLPFLEGERVPYWDRRLRGAFLGLSSIHGPEHLLRAVMEGVALSLRDCLELMRGADLPVEKPYFTGGGVTSRVWRSILAGALGQTGYLAEPQGPAVGAALIAQTAVGGAGWATARLRVKPVSPPDECVAAYDRLYGIYLDAVRATAPLSHQLCRNPPSSVSAP